MIVCLGFSNWECLAWLDLAKNIPVICNLGPTQPWELRRRTLLPSSLHLQDKLMIVRIPYFVHCNVKEITAPALHPAPTAPPALRR